MLNVSCFRSHTLLCLLLLVLSFPRAEKFLVLSFICFLSYSSFASSLSSSASVLDYPNYPCFDNISAVPQRFTEIEDRACSQCMVFPLISS